MKRAVAAGNGRSNRGRSFILDGVIHLDKEVVGKRLDGVKERHGMGI